MADEQVQKPRRVWRAVLVVSLALNVAVAGIVIGTLSRDRVAGKPPRAFELSIGPIGEALDRRDRIAIARALRNDPQLERPRRGEVRERVERVQALLRADELDAAALESELLQARDRADQIARAAISAFVAQISQMSVEDRQAFAERLRDRRTRDGAADR